MESPRSKSASKLVRSVSLSAASCSTISRGLMTREETVKDDQVFYEKYIKAIQKTSGTIKENTKPQEIKLRTQERAIKRAMFNYEVATKLYMEKQQKMYHERVQKMIEEEEIRLLRKELIPKAQLMPFFDRPFYPQRSNRPLTVPREPSLGMMSNKCSFSKKTGGNFSTCISNNGFYSFNRVQL